MTKTVALNEVPYSPDGCELFQRIRDMPDAVFLDSSHPHTRGGRYDIMAAEPVTTRVPTLASQADERQSRDFFRALGELHSEYYAGIQPASQDLPFCGGLLGYLGYELGNSLHGVAKSDASPHLPQARILPYDWCIVQDHLLHRAVLVTHPRVSVAQREQLLARIRQPVTGRAGNFKLHQRFAANLDQNQYRQAFEHIQAYIRAGDCYQVNLAQRFNAPYSGDPWHAYRQLRGLAAAPFAAYITTGPEEALLCLSPERFLSLHGNHVETSPIKGTRPRYEDRAADRLAAEELRGSQKDRAENLMIVDLLRNDLGRSCIPGSIHVDRLFEVQSFPTVHHLVSTISGELAPQRSAIELLRDSFPGGSITGAPKRRAMEIIAELEPHGRQAYCGSVLYISADGRMDSNIAIRSLICSRGEVLCWGGGGIVADSQWQMEYQETFDKVGKFLDALENSIGS